MILNACGAADPLSSLGAASEHSLAIDEARPDTQEKARSVLLRRSTGASAPPAVEWASTASASEGTFVPATASSDTTRLADSEAVTVNVSRSSSTPTTAVRQRQARTTSSSASLWDYLESYPSSEDVTGSIRTASTVDLLSQTAHGALLNPDRVPTEQWAQARRMHEQSADWRIWVDARITQLNEWMSSPRERSDLIGGWLHDYVDASTGFALTWTPRVSEPPEGQSEEARRFKRAWVAHLRDYNVRRIGDAARIYFLTGNKRYADWAASQLDFYAENYANWPLRTYEGRARMYLQGLDEATAVFEMLDAARLLGNRAGPTRVTRWKEMLFIPMAENLKHTSAPLSNISLWHAVAVAGIGMRHGRPDLIQWAFESPNGINATLASSMTSDNTWNEGSFGYNNYCIEALTRLLNIAGVEGYFSEVAMARDALRRLLLSPLDYRFADGSLPSPGDGSPAPAVDSRAHFLAYRSVSTWWGVDRANRVKDWSVLLDPPGVVPNAPNLPAVQTRNFPGNRMAVLRSGLWQAFINYGQIRVNHYQEDAPGYELHHGTTAISIDAGTTAYSSPIQKEYLKKAPAHNVPLIDGEGQSTWATGRIDLFTPTESKIIVSHPSYRSGVSVTRRFRTTSLGFTERTTLRIGDGSVRRLGAAFHTDCSVKPLSGLNPAVSTVAPPTNAATRYWSQTTTFRAAETWSALLDCNGTLYTYSVKGPTYQTVVFGTGPATPLPRKRPFIYYETASDAAEFDVTIRAQ